MSARLWIIFGVIAGVVILAVVAFANGWITVGGGDNGGKSSINLDTANLDYKKVITAADIPDSYSGDKALLADHVAGKADSKVVYVEWMNHQCSACYSTAPTIREIMEAYGDRVAFVWRYLKLSDHPNGMASAVAAEAAARQGKFYEMSDALLINQPKWGTASASEREDIFAGYATELGLDINQWRQDYKNYKDNGIEEHINFQNDLGIKSGVTYTPYIIINGEVVKGNKDELTAAIKKALGE
ncbi:MAG: thioredoxin domain-containing protein [Candidatus Nomurabacteria bacterium]|jgi:protein-disulfide isomerase|nr:thioredoxin domain-containing protein [Candidatus Nomurabacteria bacterium]